MKSFTSGMKNAEPTQPKFNNSKIDTITKMDNISEPISPAAACVDATLQTNVWSVSKEGDNESDSKRKPQKCISTFDEMLNEISQTIPVRNQFMELINDKEAIQILREKMGKWFLTHIDKALEIFKKGLETESLTYKQFCCTLIDLSAPFRCFEMYAIAMEHGLQKTGMISTEEMMKIIPSTTDPITCDICDLGMTKSGEEIPTANIFDIMKASDKRETITISKPVKSEHCSQIFLKPKKNNETNDATAANKSAFFGFGKKPSQGNKTTSGNKPELKGGGKDKITDKNSEQQGGSASNQFLSVIGESTLASTAGNVPFCNEKRESPQLDINQSPTTNKLNDIMKFDIQNKSKEVQDNNTYEEMVSEGTTKDFEKSIPGIIASDTNKSFAETKSDQIKIPSTFEMENEAKSNADLSMQPVVIDRFVLAQLRFVIYCDIVACDLHFSVLLNSNTCVSYLVYRIREVCDVHSEEIYISPNRLRLRQMLLPHNFSMKDCGYRGYCKSHPQKITLFYDYDKRYKLGFIETLNEE